MEPALVVESYMPRMDSKLNVYKIDLDFFFFVIRYFPGV